VDTTGIRFRHPLLRPAGPPGLASRRGHAATRRGRRFAARRLGGPGRAARRPGGHGLRPGAGRRPQPGTWRTGRAPHPGGRSRDGRWAGPLGGGARPTARSHSVCTCLRAPSPPTCTGPTPSSAWPVGTSCTA
jgi:hypothetical protein